MRTRERPGTGCPGPENVDCRLRQRLSTVGWTSALGASETLQPGALFIRMERRSAYDSYLHHWQIMQFVDCTKKEFVKFGGKWKELSETSFLSRTPPWKEISARRETSCILQRWNSPLLPVTQFVNASAVPQNSII